MTLFPNELEPIPYRDMAETVTHWVQSHPQLCSSKHNRLLHQCKLYIESKGIIQKTHPNWLSFIQGLKDIQEYWFIIKVFGNQLLEEPLFGQLTLSLQDPDLPQDSKAGTPGRNAQFELFIAAIAARSGLSVDRLGAGQADWLLNASGIKWSLEAKRIKNFERMEKHIRKAGKQIMASNVGGIIAVDISLAVNPNCNPLPRFVSEGDIQKAHGMRTDCFLKRFLPSIREWVGSNNVGFMLFHDYVIVPASDTNSVENSPWGLIGLWQKADLFSPSSSIKGHYDDLWSLFESALPNL